MSPADPALAVYIEHRDDLLNYASRIVRDRASAEDVVQEAWLRFSERTKRGGDIAQPANYLYIIVRNLALDWLNRTSRNARQMASDEALEGIPCEAPSAERILYYRDELRALEELVSELPVRTQIAFRMYRVERRPLKEVAERLGVSVPRVHKMVTDAILHCTFRLNGPEE
jgi:RNA polymerase sigma factor (sigma-70 family)